MNIIHFEKGNEIFMMLHIFTRIWSRFLFLYKKYLSCFFFGVTFLFWYVSMNVNNKWFFSFNVVYFKYIVYNKCYIQKLFYKKFTTLLRWLNKLEKEYKAFSYGLIYKYRFKLSHLSYVRTLASSFDPILGLRRTFSLFTRFYLQKLIFSQRRRLAGVPLMAPPTVTLTEPSAVEK